MSSRIIDWQNECEWCHVVSGDVLSRPMISVTRKLICADCWNWYVNEHLVELYMSGNASRWGIPLIPSRKSLRFYSEWTYTNSTS